MFPRASLLSKSLPTMFAAIPWLAGASPAEAEPMLVVPSEAELLSTSDTHFIQIDFGATETEGLVALDMSGVMSGLVVPELLLDAGLEAMELILEEVTTDPPDDELVAATCFGSGPCAHLQIEDRDGLAALDVSVVMIDLRGSVSERSEPMVRMALPWSAVEGEPTGAGVPHDPQQWFPDPEASYLDIESWIVNEGIAAPVDLETWLVAGGFATPADVESWIVEDELSEAGLFLDPLDVETWIFDDELEGDELFGSPVVTLLVDEDSWVYGPVVSINGVDFGFAHIAAGLVPGVVLRWEA